MSVTHTYVSIPLWFDSNPWIYLRYPLPMWVSIPLWFDSNVLQGCVVPLDFCRFQFHSGSIQTEYNIRSNKNTGEVSIPLWFDSNPRGRLWCCPQRRRFQFHSGSIQTPVARLAVWILAGRFNSTLVRFKQAKTFKRWSTASGFNSTLVRFKPEVGSWVGNNHAVSIPLWFDSNCGSVP